MNNRLSLTFDYYYKNTTDLLASMPLATSSGYTTTTTNFGNVQNKGFEIASNYKLISKGQLEWELGLNISSNSNKVISLAHGDVFGATLDIPIGIPVNLVRVGYPIGVFYAYKEQGLTADGKINYVDLDNNGVINALDRMINGDPNPDYIFGVTSSISYKNFGLSVIVVGVQGNDIFNYNICNVADGFSFGINQIKDVLGNYWTPENPNQNAKYPRISQTTKYLASDRYIEDGSYIKIQNVELSYTLKGVRFESSPINNSQIYIGVQNLLTFTKYSWYSPEVNTRGADISRGVDQTGYPIARTFLVGVRIKL